MKYHNIKCEHKGIKFDSKKERDYYIILENYEKRGLISELKRQVKFELQPSFKINNETIRSISYYADFTYIKDNKLVVVDVKSPATRKDKVYILKKKLFMYKYKIKIEEV